MNRFIFRELQESFDDGLVRAAQEGHMQNIENGVNFSQFMKDAKVDYHYSYKRFQLFLANSTSRPRSHVRSPNTIIRTSWL